MHSVRLLISITCILIVAIFSAELPLKLGSEVGIDSPLSTISTTTLSQITEGVAKENKEQIYFYGLLKLYGINYPKSETTAATHFLKASELGHIEAMTAYSVLLMTGIGVNKDISQAIVWLKKAISHGNIQAQWLLGKLYLEYEHDNTELLQQAVQYIQNTAIHYHIPQAQHLLGIIYEYGYIIEQNFQQAKYYYELAGTQQYLESIYHLGLLYTFGRGISINYMMGLSLFETAANQDHSGAIYYIAIFHMYGYGIPVNYEKALFHFQRVVSLQDGYYSLKAEKAVQELTPLLASAQQYTMDILSQLSSRSIDIHNDL